VRWKLRLGCKGHYSIASPAASKPDIELIGVFAIMLLVAAMAVSLARYNVQRKNH
jgi:hypothetical protein